MTNGITQTGKHYTIQTLINTLGKVATDAEAEAVATKEAIEELKAGIKATIAVFNEKITADNTAWVQQVTANLEVLTSALEEALVVIGRSDTEGTRKAVLDAITASRVKCLQL